MVIFTPKGMVQIGIHVWERELLWIKSREPGVVEWFMAPEEVEVYSIESADYKFRADVTREQVAEATSRRIHEIDYELTRIAAPAKSMNRIILGQALVANARWKHFEPNGPYKPLVVNSLVRED